MKKDKPIPKYSYYTFVGFYTKHSTRVQDWYKTLFYVDASAFNWEKATKLAKEELGEAYLKGLKGYWRFSEMFRDKKTGNRIIKVHN